MAAYSTMQSDPTKTDPSLPPPCIPTPLQDDGLEDMTMNELKAAAKKAGINTFAAKRKDLITRLRALRASS